MSEERPPASPAPASGRAGRPTRRLSLPSRLRESFRRGADKLLSMERVWSVLLVAVTLLMLGNERCGVDYPELRTGEMAEQEIRALTDVELPDEEETEARRREAREAVPDIYVHDSERGTRLLKAFVQLFRGGRALPEDKRLDARPAMVDEAAWRALVRQQFAEDLEGELVTILRKTLRPLIVGNRALLEASAEIQVVRVPSGREERLLDFGSILDLERARRDAREAVQQLGLARADRDSLADLVAGFVDANLTFDPERTAQRRTASAQAVSPVLVKLPRGEVLVRAGETITEETQRKLAAARAAGSSRLGVTDFFGLLLVVGLVAFLLFRYASHHQRHFRKLRHLHALLVLVQLSVLAIGKGMLWVAAKVVGTLDAPFDDLRLYFYLIPLAAGTIIVALLTNGRIAMVHAAFASLLFATVADWDAYNLVWGLLVQWCAVYAISTYKDRTALLRAGLAVGAVGAVTALAMEALRGSLEPWSHSLYGAGLAFVGGAVGVGLLVSFGLPLLEGLFHVLTDVRLLELSNSNHPLISELAVKAPGTYNHSLIVGTLAEEAARAIGANALFCKVAAAYHDIGKMLKPDYYVENQRGTNPHDRLSPSMSALVLVAHVKDGVKLAREAGLPDQIVDIIPQHHGTRLMKFFHEKARRQLDPGMGSVNEAEFRYPGPKPQTREAAIFMLADGVEAAARTLDEPTPNRIQEVIRKVTNAIVLEEQLDECDLTFAELERVQQAFQRFLVSMHHHRVDYPGFNFNRPDPPADTDGDTAAAHGS